MDYKLFDDYITLQALLKEVGIIQSGGAIKAFLAENQVYFNDELENRRGKKIRVGDVISIPAQEFTLTIVEPSLDEKQQHQEAERHHVEMAVVGGDDVEGEDGGGVKKAVYPRPTRAERDFFVYRGIPNDLFAQRVALGIKVN